MSNYVIPFLDLKAQYNQIRTEVDEAVQKVIESQYFILGPEVEGLELEIAAYSNCEFGVGVSSGTDALLLSLMVLGIEPGDEVITTSFTFFATAGAISRLGAKPVFIDIDPLTYNIDINQLEAHITSNTKAIIPVHLYGQMTQMTEIMQIAEKHNLFVIEDAAQAIGAEWHNQRAGSVGHLGCFSFFPSKNLGGFGDGGMVVTQSHDLDQKLRLFRNHGYKPKYYNAVIGGNFRLDAIQAAVLRIKLKYLDQWTEARQHNAYKYRELFFNVNLSVSLDEFVSDEHGIVVPIENENSRHIYNQFVIRCHKRDQLMAYLKSKGISTEVYYPLPMHLQECFSDLGYSLGDLPASEAAARELLALPIYPELTPSMLGYVVENIAQFYKQRI